MFKKHIPNTITCGNLVCGCIATHFAFQGAYALALAFIIAGAVARRIVTYATEGEDCYIDEHLGFIKFGSRVDVYLPLNTEINVKVGQPTVGNQTVIGHLKPNQE